MDISVPLRRTTEDRISIVLCTSVILGFADIVVVIPDSSLAVLDIVSPAVNVPFGMLTVIVVELGFVSTVAVAPLVCPVIALPTTRLVEAPTVAVIVPRGYSARPDTTVWLT